MDKWIHLEDLVNLYIFALEKPTINGNYNAVAEDIPTNEKLMKILARMLCKFAFPYIFPPFYQIAIKRNERHPFQWQPRLQQKNQIRRI